MGHRPSMPLRRCCLGRPILVRGPNLATSNGASMLSGRYFQHLESDPHGQGPHHGRNGPIPIARYSEGDLIPIQRAFFDGCLAAGLPKVDDHNDLESSGVGPWPMNRSGDTRISTLLSHVNHARTRNNLTIRANCPVDRLLFEGDRVCGVQLVDGSVQEGDRVTLCAGSIGSPAILMRSGVGPARELEALGIQSIIDLPGVGARIWDHAAVPIRLVPNPGECVIGRDPRFQVMARFTAPGSSRPDDMQLVMTTHLDLRSTPSLIEEAGVPVVAALRVALMLPLGHGRLSLQSPDPAAQPKIDLNYCCHPEDRHRLIEGVRFAWKVLRTGPMANAYQRIAGISEDVVGSNERLENYVRANIGTYCHASGTAPIGADQRSVRGSRSEMQGSRRPESVRRGCRGIPDDTERGSEPHRDDAGGVCGRLAEVYATISMRLRRDALRHQRRRVA